MQLHLVKKPPLKHLKPIMIVFSTTIAATIYISSDTTILGWLTDVYHVGIYGTAAKIYNIVKQVLKAVVAVVIPRFAFYIGTQEKDKILQLGKKLIEDGEKDARKVIAAIRGEIEKEPLAKIDYVEIVVWNTLEPVESTEGEILTAMAVYIGKTRLIDNFIK